MIDLPTADLFDDSFYLLWLERHLHPGGFSCPYCRSADRRLFRHQGHYNAYRCRTCDRYYTLLTATVFEGSRKPPEILVRLLRSIVKGDSTAQIARELQLSRQTVHTLRQRIAATLANAAPEKP
jgi:transposase-like protein